jgi:NDP-sugar pyrophosphorylase family protein
VKAVILAAGKGTRMRELTNELPKPMLKVEGKPILEHILEGILAAGIREVFIVTGFKAETIEDYFGDGSNWKARIAYGRQLVQDGTGKAPELAKDFTGASPFLLTYGDILVKPETYQQMLHRYREDHFSGVITVTGSEDVTKGGLVFFDEKFCLKRLVEKPDAAQIKELTRDGWLKPGDTAWYNAGIYIFRPSLFEFTARLQKSPRGEYELTDAISALVAAHHPIAGMKIAGRWVDVRDPEVLAKLEERSDRISTNASGYSITDLLELAVSEKAERLTLKMGESPVLQVRGETHQIEGPPVTAENADSLFRSLADSRRTKELREKHEIQFFHDFRGSSRFIVHAKLENDCVSLVLELLKPA